MFATNLAPRIIRGYESNGILISGDRAYKKDLTIKGFTEPEPFLDSVCRKLDELSVAGEPSVGPRRVVKVGNHTIVGFGLAIHELSDEGSITLQECGLGGRRRMGCGIFFPITHSPFDKEEKQ